MYTDGQQLNQNFLIKNTAFLTTKKGDEYVSLTLSTEKGTLNAKLWDTPHNTFPYKNGQVIHATGSINIYQEEPQLRITSSHALPANDPLANPMLYIEHAPIEIEQMTNYLVNIINNIQNNFYKDIVLHIMQLHPNNNQFTQQPASKRMHHDFGSGLLYHTYRMLQSAVQLSQIYTVNTDLLFSALILHDAGKLLELSGPLDTEYTIEGTLLGHISILDGWITTFTTQNYPDKIDNIDFVLLRHTLLAHHGQKDWGSPVNPATKEAILLHYLDNIDAKMTMAEQELKQTPKNTLSKPVFGLDRTRLYATLET